MSHRPAKSEKANNNDRHISETTTLVSHRFRETVYALCGQTLGYFYFDYEREVTEKNGTIALTEGIYVTFLFFVIKKERVTPKKKLKIRSLASKIFNSFVIIVCSACNVRIAIKEETTGVAQ